MRLQREHLSPSRHAEAEAASCRLNPRRLYVEPSDRKNVWHVFVDLHSKTSALGLVWCFERKGWWRPEEREKRCRGTKGNSLHSFSAFPSSFQHTLQQITQSRTHRFNNRTQCPLPLPSSLTLAVSFDGLAHQLEIIRMSCSLVRPAGLMQHRRRKSTFQGRTPSQDRRPLLFFFLLGFSCRMGKVCMIP